MQSTIQCWRHTRRSTRTGIIRPPSSWGITLPPIRDGADRAAATICWLLFASRRWNERRWNATACVPCNALRFTRSRLQTDRQQDGIVDVGYVRCATVAGEPESARCWPGPVTAWAWPSRSQTVSLRLHIERGRDRQAGGTGPARAQNMTLPLIHALANMTASEQRDVESFCADPDPTERGIEHMIALVQQHEGIGTRWSRRAPLANVLPPLPPSCRLVMPLTRCATRIPPYVVE